MTFENIQNASLEEISEILENNFGEFDIGKVSKLGTDLVEVVDSQGQSGYTFKRYDPSKNHPEKFLEIIQRYYTNSNRKIKHNLFDGAEKYAIFYWELK